MPIQKIPGSKNGKQRYRVRINYTDKLGIYRQIERIAYGASEAKDLERQLLYEVNQNPQSKKMTVQELYQEYIASKQGEIREATLRRSITAFNNHILPVLKDVTIDRLSPQILTAWKNQINEKTTTVKGKEGQRLQIKTKQNIYSELRAVLNYAVKMEYIPTNPLVRVGNFKDANVIQKEMLYYTPEEFKKFITVARKNAENSSLNTAWDFYVFFCIAFYTGLRKGEVHALKWSDLNGNYLSVKRSITQKIKGGDKETPPKNKSSIRTIQIPTPLMTFLAEHKNRYSILPEFSDDYRICGGIRPLRDTSIENANKKFAYEAGVKKIRIHDFRHSHASVLVNNGINIQEVARRLGHSDIEMTWNTYSHLYPKEEERATAVLNEIV